MLRKHTMWGVIALVAGMAATAIGAPPGPRSFGTVGRVAGNGRSFDLVDGSGNSMTIPITESTQYRIGNGMDSSAAEVLTPGEPVVVHFGLDGTAIEVDNRSRGHRQALELRPMLDLNDAEWGVIRPLLAHYIDEDLAATGRGDGDVRSLKNRLRFLVRMHANESDLAAVMSQLQQAQTRAQAELERARQALVPLLTLRQEAYLVQQGILE